MLVLSRKVDQEILIGDDIKLTIVRVDGNRVRIGICAPSDVRILRGELTDAGEMEVDGELSEREMAFAHPPQPHPTKTKRVGRPTQKPVETMPIQQDATVVFSGTVSADGGSVELSRVGHPHAKRAPLANFVAAT